MKRSEMIKKIAYIALTDQSGNAIGLAEAILKACEDAGMLPPIELTQDWHEWEPE